MKRHFTSVVNATPAAMQLDDLTAEARVFKAQAHHIEPIGTIAAYVEHGLLLKSAASSLALVAVYSSLNKTINKAGEGVPVSELAIARGAAIRISQ